MRGLVTTLFILYVLPSAVWAQQPPVDPESIFKALKNFDLPRTNNCCVEQPQDWRNSLPRILKSGDRVHSEVIMFVTHPSTIWDKGATIQQTLDQGLTTAQLFGIPTVYLVHSSNRDSLEGYYPKVRPNYLYLSEAGEHKIRTSARIGIFTGGLSEMCAVSTLHDFILGGDFSRSPLVALLPSDAIYSRSAVENREQGATTPLKRRIENLSDPEFFSFIRTQYFSNKYIGRGYDSEKKQKPIEDYVIRILRDGKEVGRLGNGKKEVLVHFLEKKTLKTLADETLKPTHPIAP